MRRTTYLIFFFSITIFATSCSKDTIAPITTSSPAWTQTLTDWHFNGEEIYVGAKVEENQLRLVSVGSFMVLDANGQYENNTSTLFDVTNPIGIKPAMNSSFTAVSDQRFPFIQIYDNMCTSIYGCSDDEWFDGVNNYHFLLDITGLNLGKDVGALNTSDGFITSVVRKGYANRINLLYLSILGSHLRAPVQPNLYVHPDSTNYHKIELPDEGDTVVKRIQSFQQNFFVSTAHYSYMVRPDGSFKQIFNRSTREFFIYNNAVYADFGDAIYASPDDGETWILKHDNLKDGGFRQFFTVKDSLCFFRNDSIFAIHPDDTYNILNNSGLSGDEITSVNEFIDNVYVSTLSGLFYKKSCDLYK